MTYQCSAYMGGSSVAFGPNSRTQWFFCKKLCYRKSEFFKKFTVRARSWLWGFAARAGSDRVQDPGCHTRARISCMIQIQYRDEGTNSMNARVFSVYFSVFGYQGHARAYDKKPAARLSASASVVGRCIVAITLGLCFLLPLCGLGEEETHIATI